MTTHMTKTWFVDGQIIEEPIPEAEMNTNRSGNLHEVMHQAAWDSATRVPEGDIRALKHRIHELEGEVVGYKQILDTQPEPAECDGGQCGIGGYCKQCPKTQPEQKPVAWITTWNESNDAGVELHWAKQDKGLSSKYTPLYTTPPQREWVGLTDEEYEAIREDGQFGKGSIRFKNLFEAIEAKLKEKNT